MYSYFKKCNWAAKIILLWCLFTVVFLPIGLYLAVVFDWDILFIIGMTITFIGFILITPLTVHARFP